MTAEHIYQRANEAAVSVDPMVLAHALDHIARTAAKSRSQTRRIRWIEQRALCALEGREYRDIDVELPKCAGPDTAEKLKAKADHYKRMNAELLAAAKQAEALIPHLCDLDSSAAAASVVEQLRAAIARATGGAS